MIFPVLVGQDGPTGPAGSNGNTWTSGSGAPSNGSGTNGDLYLRTSNQDVYLKSADVWAVITNIKGAAGNNGSNGSDGATGPTGPAGQDLVLPDMTTAQFKYLQVQSDGEGGFVPVWNDPLPATPGGTAYLQAYDDELSWAVLRTVPGPGATGYFLMDEGGVGGYSWQPVNQVPGGGATGQVLTLDGSLTPQWQEPSGGGGGSYPLTTGDGVLNVDIGYNLAGGTAPNWTLYENGNADFSGTIAATNLNSTNGVTVNNLQLTTDGTDYWYFGGTGGTGTGDLVCETVLVNGLRLGTDANSNWYIGDTGGPSTGTLNANAAILNSATVTSLYAGTLIMPAIISGANDTIFIGASGGSPGSTAGTLELANLIVRHTGSTGAAAAIFTDGTSTFSGLMQTNGGVAYYPVSGVYDGGDPPTIQEALRRIELLLYTLNGNSNIPNPA